jgi:YesN/AraC family two-component response regulator
MKLKRLLYVEDDLTSQEIAVMFLEEFFNQIDVASNGKEALELFKKNRYDVIISDINMPIMSGIELFKQIRKQDKKTALILLSAYEEEVLQEHNLEINGFLSKPIDIEEFIKLIEKIKKEKINPS